MLSVPAIKLKVRRFKPGRERWIYKDNKLRKTTSFGVGEVKPSAPCRKILHHVKDPAEYDRDTSPAKLKEISSKVSPCFAIRYIFWYLPDNAGG
jgi:hypothetical protein